MLPSIIFHINTFLFIYIYNTSSSNTFYNTSEGAIHHCFFCEQLGLPQSLSPSHKPVEVDQYQTKIFVKKIKDLLADFKEITKVISSFVIGISRPCVVFFFFLKSLKKGKSIPGFLVSTKDLESIVHLLEFNCCEQGNQDFLEKFLPHSLETRKNCAKFFVNWSSKAKPLKPLSQCKKVAIGKYKPSLA